MRILLISNYLPDAQESMQRFTLLLQKGLLELGHEVTVIRPELIIGNKVVFSSTLSKWLGYIDKFLLFPHSQTFKSSLDWADVVHIIDHSNAVYLSSLGGKAHVLTCNDLLAISSALGVYPQNPTGWSGRLFQNWILKNINRANSIACISENTRNDLLRYSHINRHNATVIHMGLNYDYRNISHDVEDSNLIVLTKQPYFLHVGGNQWYKNRLGVLRIFRRLMQLLPNPYVNLIMVGKSFTFEMTNYVQDCSLDRYVFSLVSVPNHHLEYLYNKAVALIFPSLTEGFGWPVIEAQACGCPVVCSSEGPLPEVAGEAALMSPASDEEQLAIHLYTILTKHETRNSLIAKGYENVKRFQPRSMVNKYVDLYRKVVHSN